jgi:hypothetical protein
MTGGWLFHPPTSDTWLHSFLHTALAPNLQILEALDSVSGNVLDFYLAGKGYVARG